VLTDYHVHLRLDQDDTPPERYFTAANAERYRTVAEERGIAELGVAEHIHRFTQALDVWQHPWWRRWARDDVDAYCAFVREETDLRLGIEADYVAGREDRIASFLDARDWDYVVGSVHFIRDAAVDIEGPDWEHVWGRGESADRIWERYFLTLAAAARSGLYDIMAHPDLVKIWGSARPQPERDPRHYYEPAVEAMLDAGVAIECSTAGLRKPVGELYPGPALLAMAVEAGIPVALSSDAHAPDQLGYRYEDAVAALTDAGVTELCVFERRERRLEPLG
jgi:histidinol-phosphatase (PHP family)